jgi:hypothetical protein
LLNKGVRLSNSITQIQEFLKVIDENVFNSNIDKIFEKINKEIKLETKITNDYSYMGQAGYQLVYKAIQF